MSAILRWFAMFEGVKRSAGAGRLNRMFPISFLCVFATLFKLCSISHPCREKCWSATHTGATSKHNLVEVANCIVQADGWQAL